MFENTCKMTAGCQAQVLEQTIQLAVEAGRDGGEGRKRGCKGHFFRVAIWVLAIIVLFPSWATCEENNILQALERVKVGIEDKVSYRELGERLDEARTQINALKRGQTNECFRVAAHTSYYWYDLGRKSWQTLMINQRQRDKYARQAEYGEHHLKAISTTIAKNYDKLVRHAQDALSTKWEYGNAALLRAHHCLNKP